MNLLERRRTMSQSKSVNKSYTPVNYIRANWNEYIDTGIYPNMSTEVDVVFMPHSVANTNFVISSRYGWKDRDLTIRNNGVFSFYNQESYAPQVTAIDIQFHAILMNTATTEPTWTRKNGTITRMDTGEHVRNQNLSLPSTIELNSEYSLYLFACNNAGTASFLASMNLYSAIIKNEGVVVFDGIPVLDSDGTPCVYDRVSDNFFYGQRGVGFTYG